MIKIDDQESESIEGGFLPALIAFGAVIAICAFADPTVTISNGGSFSFSASC